MSEAAGWFDSIGTGAPSADLKVIGTVVSGEVIDQYLIGYVPFGKTEVAKDERTGEEIKQLAVVLQTDQRNWDGVAKIPTVSKTDPTPKVPELDDGKRAVYLRRFTNIHAAVGKAVKGAGAEALESGGVLSIKFLETEDTGKGNPLKKFAAKYEAPKAPAPGGDGFFGGATDASSDEPPF